MDGGEWLCGVAGFDCRDPAFFDPTLVGEFPYCAGDWLSIGDGSCNAENNVAACGWDGGDVSSVVYRDLIITYATALRVAVWLKRCAPIKDLVCHDGS